MNKINQYLVPASLAALLFALLGGLWLVWQTIEESRSLERHNRELQASLEASRIRVANFCEYPTEALCRVDERSGLVSGVMPGELVGTPESGERHAPVPVMEIMPERNAASALAIEHAEKPEKAQEAIPPQALASDMIPELPAAAEEKTSFSAPQSSSAEEEKQASPQQESQPASSAPSSPAPDSETEAEKLHDRDSQAEVPASEASRPSVEKPKYGHEITGKLVPASPVLSEEKTAEPAVIIEKKEAPADAPLPTVIKPAESPKKTWSRTDLDGNIFTFTLTGAGPSLPAQGTLLSSPWRYELRLSGRWEIRQHPDADHRLVGRISTGSDSGDTVVTFHLKNKPYRCSLHRPDERTVSIRIR